LRTVKNIHAINFIIFYNPKCGINNTKSTLRKGKLSSSELENCLMILLTYPLAIKNKQYYIMKERGLVPKRFKGVIIVFLLWSLLLAPLYAEEKSPDIAVIVSSQIRPYIVALEGLRSQFQQSLSIYYLNSNPEFIRHHLNHKQYDLLIAIGPEASIFIWSTLNTDNKKVALMVLDPQKLLSDPEPCGVDLRIPFKDQISLIRQRLGEKRKIGILYNPIENKEWIEEAQKEGAKLGIRIIPLMVHKRSEIMKIVSSAYQYIDTLLFIPDSTVISMTLISHLVKDALLHGIAVVGYNHFFLEVGAVLAFNINYEKVGILGAKIAEDILAGSSCKLYPPPFEVEWNEKAWKKVTEYVSNMEASGSEGKMP
jgi:putative ABC transport system substrate-binding protein